MNFALHKGEFIDAVLLCPSCLSSHCSCGKDFSLSHTLSCPHSASDFPTKYEIINLTASLVSHNVQLEPHLQPLSGETMHYCSAFQEVPSPLYFFDVRASNCFAASKHSFSLTAAHWKHKLKKCQVYKECIYHSSFTLYYFLHGKSPINTLLIFSARNRVCLILR